MNTLAIDIGGTKFTIAAFEGERMARRESRATDREGGRDWMLGQIAGIAAAWRREAAFDVCGIGFGGPVDFDAQRVALSTHVGGWQDFALPEWVERTIGLPAVMDNDANVGALGEAIHGAGQGASPLSICRSRPASGAESSWTTGSTGARIPTPERSAT